MSFRSSPFAKCCKVPISLHTYFPKPVHDPHNDDTIIISTDYKENGSTPGIYKYNVMNNQLQMIYKYLKSDVEVGNHGQLIDESRNKLILYGGFNKIWNTIDLDTHKMNVSSIERNETALCIYSWCWTTNAFISTPMNQIHIMDIHGEHHMYNVSNAKTIQIQKHFEFNSHDFECPKLFYIQYCEQLFIFGSYASNKIFSYYNKIWNPHTLQMPYSETSESYKILNGFVDVLFVFYFKQKEIFVLHFVTMKWYKCEYSIPNDFIKCNEACVVLKMNDYGHIIDFDKGIHFKVCLFDLIPNGIILSHRKFWKTLIMGYVTTKQRIITDNNTACFKNCNIKLFSVLNTQFNFNAFWFI